MLQPDNWWATYEGWVHFVGVTLVSHLFLCERVLIVAISPVQFGLSIPEVPPLAKWIYPSIKTFRGALFHLLPLTEPWLAYMQDSLLPPPPPPPPPRCGTPYLREFTMSLTFRKALTVHYVSLCPRGKRRLRVFLYLLLEFLALLFCSINKYF